jgi:hypothetical protein
MVVASDEAARGVARRVAGDTGGHLVTLDAPSQSVLDDVRAALDRARQLAVQWNVEAAIETLAETQRTIEATGESPEHFALLHDVLATRALIESDRGAAGTAAALLAEALAIAPERSLDAARFPPDFVAQHQAGAERAQNTARVELRIESVPDAADVWLDGIAAGRTPATVRVLPGRHHVRVASPGRETVRMAVTTGGPSTTQSIMLPWAEGAALADGVARDIERTARLSRDARTDIASRLDVLITVARSVDGTVHARAFEFDGGHVRDAAVRWPDGAADVAALARRRARPASRPAEDEGSVLESPWFYAAAAVVVAAAAVGVVWVVADNPSPVVRLSQDR